MDDDEWHRMITGLRNGDADACTDFWKAYGPLLESVAQRQLSGRLQRRVGSDDIVQSACRTFFRRVSDGQFDLHDAEALWRLICSITLTKVRRSARNQLRQKRGMDREQYLDAEDADGNRLGSDMVEQVDSPIDAAMVADEMQSLLAGLGEREAAILDLKLQQFTNDEIADKLACSERTVRRVMTRLQERWLEFEE